MAPALSDIHRGRNLAAYCAMFSLGDSERQLSILGCGDGSASFNAEGTAQSMRIVSVDPLYRLRAADMRQQIQAAGLAIAGATQQFLADYETGIAQGRYVSGELPELPFHDHCYDLALCSYQLFQEEEPRDLAFHLRALQELTRVAEEVRVAPLPVADGKPNHLRAAMLALPRMGLRGEVLNQMLRITR